MHGPWSVRPLGGSDRAPSPGREAPRDTGPNRAAPRIGTISDQELTLAPRSAATSCAPASPLPLSLVLLAGLSSVPVNEPGQLMTNMKIDSLFPVAVVVALALGGVYRVTHRSLQPSAFLEMRELAFGVGCGCVLALAIGSFLRVAFGTTEPFATQLVLAVVVTIGVVTLGRMALRFFLHA